MAGETDLALLLRGMKPALHPEPWGFALWPGTALPVGAFALIREAEGMTLIAPVSVLVGLGLEAGLPMALVTLTIHSSLEAIGLTAVISAALAAEGISANVVAGYHHDHVFLTWERRADALLVLAGLARG
jgi:hypothetical protein